MTTTIPDTTVRAISLIVEETGVEEPVVRLIVDRYVKCIKDCLENEIPFCIRGFARFYHAYISRKSSNVHHEDKVHKTVKMVLTPDAKAQLDGWVHDLGVKDNRPHELMKIKLKPDEIAKVRRRRTLEDQRTLGFRSELLFDEPHQQDTLLEKELGESPSVEEIMRRIGINIDND